MIFLLKRKKYNDNKKTEVDYEEYKKLKKFYNSHKQVIPSGKLSKEFLITRRIRYENNTKNR